jgi:hypothetical protein
MEDLRPDQPSGMSKIQDWLNFEECLHRRRVWYEPSPLQAQRVEGDLSGLVWPAASAAL